MAGVYGKGKVCLPEFNKGCLELEPGMHAHIDCVHTLYHVDFTLKMIQ